MAYHYNLVLKRYYGLSRLSSRDNAVYSGKIRRFPRSIPR